MLVTRRCKDGQEISGGNQQRAGRLYVVAAQLSCGAAAQRRPAGRRPGTGAPRQLFALSHVEPIDGLRDAARRIPGPSPRHSQRIGRPSARSRTCRNGQISAESQSQSTSGGAAQPAGSSLQGEGRMAARTRPARGAHQRAAQAALEAPGTGSYDRAIF